MFSHGINEKIYSIDLNANDREKIIKYMEKYQVEKNNIDFFELKRDLLQRLRDLNNNRFYLTILEHSFILQVISEDIPLYQYLSFNLKS